MDALPKDKEVIELEGMLWTSGSIPRTKKRKKKVNGILKGKQLPSDTVALGSQHFGHVRQG